MNHIALLGRLTHEPELRRTPQGTPVVSFSIAVDRPGTHGENRKTDFINCVAWKGSGEAMRNVNGLDVTVIGVVDADKQTMMEG